jgi:hypothetical protein
MFEKTYRPLSLLTASRLMPVADSVAVTFAPAMIAPIGSLIVPVRVAFAACCEKAVKCAEMIRTLKRARRVIYNPFSCGQDLQDLSG